MAVFDIRKRVFVLITVKAFEMIVEVEIRCELVSLRKTMLLLIIKQFTS
jgi:hypothetical protein